MKRIIRYQKSAHGTMNVFLYNITEPEIIKWFEMVDIWGSKGRHYEDGSIYFELQIIMYDVLSKLPFIHRYNIFCTDSVWE